MAAVEFVECWLKRTSVMKGTGITLDFSSHRSSLVASLFSECPLSQEDTGRHGS